jgi:hypothetical protein
MLRGNQLLVAAHQRVKFASRQLVPPKRAIVLLLARELACCEARPFSQCRQLGPDDARMDFARSREAGEAAIGAGDHILPPDDTGKARDPLGDCLGMLDQVGRRG